MNKEEREKLNLLLQDIQNAVGWQERHEARIKVVEFVEKLLRKEDLPRLAVTCRDLP